MASAMSESAREFVCGWVGGIAGLVAGHPLDTVKVRMQAMTMQAMSYQRMVVTARQITKTEGLAGLFKGMSSPVAGVAAMNAVLFSSYGSLERLMPGYTAAGVNPLTSVFYAGFGSGIVCSFVTTPIDLVKLRLQNQATVKPSGPGLVHYSGNMDVLRQVVRARGPAGLYQGLGITFLRDGPGYGTYFAVYECAKRALTVPHANATESALATLAAGALAGVLGWMCTYPFDVVKSRLQLQPEGQPLRYTGIVDCFKKSYREGGVRVFFQGQTAAVLRAIPVNAMTFLTYELTKDLLQNRA